MKTLRHPAVEVIAAAYSRGDDVDLRALLREHPPADDLVLAEIIEADAARRLTMPGGVELSRYLTAVPDLRSRTCPLDAAIEFALRSRAGQRRPTKESLDGLIRDYPDLEAPIREAYVLAQALETDDGVAMLAPEKGKPLPRGFGPKLTSDRPRYVLKELLGKGSHGAVYLAIDRQLSDRSRPARVAIKVLAGTGTPGARKRLVDEASKARRIEHESVVRVLDRGTTSRGDDYVVFEYVSGGSLDRWLKKQRRPIPPRQAAELVARIARGVQAAHTAGLVHCDLKPANIILTEAGLPKVADFGVAVRDYQAYAAAIKAGTDMRPIGNLAFIPPEQHRLEPGALAPSSDIYALGGMLYYFLTDTLPNGSTVQEIEATHRLVGGRQAPPSPRAKNPRVDPSLDAVCRRALSIRPADRYPTADALADDLERWLRHEPIRGGRVPLPHTAMLFARRQPWTVVAVVTAFVFALLAGALVGYRLGRGSAPASPVAPTPTPTTSR